MVVRNIDACARIGAHPLKSSAMVSPRRATWTSIVPDPPIVDMAQFALIEMRGAGRLAFGGFFEDGKTLAIVKTADADEARRWFAESGFWKPEALTTRPWLHVL